MPTIYRFPPVGISAYESSIDDPMNASRGINGGPRYSQTRANRSIYVAEVSGIGPDGNGAGYVEALKRLLAGRPPLVQVDTLPATWWGRTRDRPALQSGDLLSWTTGGAPLTWTTGGEPLTWYTSPLFTATPGKDDFDYIDVTGLPDGTEVFPGDAVQVGGDVSYAMRSETIGGVRRIYLTSALPAGNVDIGATVTRNFSLNERPRSMQTQGAFSYTFEMTEVFASDFSDGLTVLDPWN